MPKSSYKNKDYHALMYPEHHFFYNSKNIFSEIPYETPVVKGVEEFLTAMGIINFGRGVANGTTISTTTNMVKCQNAF